MGACNSLTRGFEVGGAFAGAGLVTAFSAATGNPELAAAVDPSLIAVGIGATKKGNGCDKSKSGLITSVNDIVSRSITKTIINCTTDGDSSQDVIIKCNPKVITNLHGDTCYEANESCGNCLNTVLADMKAQDAMERNMWKYRGIKVRQPLDITYATMVSQLQSCGLSHCKACVLLNVTQLNLIKANGTCINDQINRTNIKTNLDATIQSEFTNNQDVLSAAAQVFGIDTDTTKLVEHISNSLMTTISDTFVTNLKNVLNSTQSIEIFSTSSVETQFMTQSSILTSTSKYVTDTGVAEKSFGDIQFDQMSTIVNQQNTLNDLGEVIFESTITFTKALDSSVGKIMFAVLILLGVVICFIIGFIIYKAVKKSLKRVLQTSSDKQIVRRNESAFQQF